MLVLQCPVTYNEGGHEYDQYKAPLQCEGLGLGLEFPVRRAAEEEALKLLLLAVRHRLLGVGLHTLGVEHDVRDRNDPAANLRVGHDWWTRKEKGDKRRVSSANKKNQQLLGNTVEHGLKEPDVMSGYDVHI